MNPKELRKEVREKKRNEYEKAIPSSFRLMNEEDKVALKKSMGKSFKKRKRRFRRLAHWRGR